MTTDPPGLDEAIEAACAARYGASWPTSDKGLAFKWRSYARADLLAAAPALRAGALRGAARELGASETRSWSRAETFAWLIEMADRIDQGEA